jgi:ribosome-associated toxin RatA of RatAB toxin-antitoxin module
MARVELQSKVTGRSAREVFSLLSDLEKYPSLGTAVRSLTVSREGGRTVSSWEVDFHGGVMRWKEEDVFLPDECTLRFRQIDGDMDSFTGEWRITDTDEGCVVDFRADFDLGVSGLSAILEPIAEQALRDNTRSILSAMVGAETIK